MTHNRSPIAASPRNHIDQAAAPRGGKHRVSTPPTALKGRATVVAVAAGAMVAGGHAVISNLGSSDVKPATTEIALAGSSSLSGGAAIAPQAPQVVPAVEIADASPYTGPQVLNVATPIDVHQFADLLQKGQKYAQDRAAEEAAKLRPLFVKVTDGAFTSGYGARWGTLHAGVDIANAIGTPILAVADGVVIDAGPASGFGLWVRLLHADGTVTVYGHVDSATVQVGQHVMAGDEIAKMGNRGFSTGPHLHFEVWLNGTDKVDPAPWLAARGISLGRDLH
jgi:murein DD-endopeptidase MepM/ murein hydrolase activator NlpD